MNIAVLGATGSIGTQTLDVISECLPDARVCALTGFSNIDKLAEAVIKFKPPLVCTADEQAADCLKQRLNGNFSGTYKIVTGDEGLTYCAAESGADVVVNALVGRAGLAPTLAAINAGINVALANKETLVTAGELVMKKAREKNVRITPIDSEHSAILQCLQGNGDNPPEKLIITASGGPFRKWTKERIAKATAEDALRHPTWNMGAKITIDSATLMNKGLEVIEAMRLYDMPLEKIEVVIHPQSVIHSMVEFADGAVMAQLGVPDMRVPISYALTQPRRAANNFTKLNLLEYNSLTFGKPDTERFPCLRLALYAAETGGTLPAVMNYLNELAVGLFLQNKISFYSISDIISRAFDAYIVTRADSPEDITEAEAWAEGFFKNYRIEV